MRKNNMRKLLLLALITLLVMALAACKSQPKLEKIELEGYRDSFFVGDPFETGADFVLYAVYDNGDRVPVTEGYQVKTDYTTTSAAGKYTVTVEYGGKKEVYNIQVVDAGSLLQSLRLDPSGAKTSFMLGDAFDFSGIRLTAVYKTDTGAQIEMVYSDLSRFQVTVTDANGNKITDNFPEFGKYTISVAQGDISASYEVNVEGVNLDTVGNAIYAAKYGFRNVNKGTMKKIDTIAGSKTADFEYAFGDNYTYIKSTSVSDAYGAGMTEDHYSLDPSGSLINAKVENGNLITSSTYVAEAMNGVQVGLWWQAEIVYGMESVIANIYKYGCNNPNGDYVETVDPQTNTYKFSYTYRMERITGVENDDYFFYNEVTFTIGEQYAMSSAYVKQVLYTHDFTIGEEKTTLNEGATPAYTLELEMEQSVGEKTIVNPYGADTLLIKDYDLVYDGDVLGADDVIYGNAGIDLTLRIDNLDPGTASLAYDLMYFSDGKGRQDASLFTCDGFVVYRRDNIIHLKLAAGGDWTLVLSNKNVTKQVKLSVTGYPPTSMTTMVYQSAFNSFSEAATATPLVGKALYFLAEPNQYANGDYTARLEGDPQGVTLEKAQIGGKDCWKIVAARAGTYKVIMTSTEAPEVNCSLDITAVDAPDLATVLNGTYKATDMEGNTYIVTFAQENTDTDAISGTVTVTCGTQSETMDFIVSEEDLTLNLNPESSLGIDIKVDAHGKLVLEDAYEYPWELIKQ